MKSLRSIVILAALSLIGIIVTQVYWVSSALEMKGTMFDENVQRALYAVSRKLASGKFADSRLLQPVKQLRKDYYVVRVDDVIDANYLEYVLKDELTKRSLRTNFEYSIYDCGSESLVYGSYVQLKDFDAERQKPNTDIKLWPNWDKESYYFAVYFPEKFAFTLAESSIWMFSTAVMLFVVGFFAYSLYVILEQKRLSKVQKDFINNLTHEFKTPISTISLSAEAIKSPAFAMSAEKLSTYASIIQFESKRLASQVETILQVAKADKNAFALKRERVPIGPLVEEIVLSLSGQAEKRGTSISIDIEPKDLSWSVDPLHFGNMIFNLIDNAVKYGKEAGEVVLKIGVERKDLKIVVLDDGPGIAKKEWKQVFEQFYRVEQDNTAKTKGFGLGLYYVRQIVRGHGGRIELGVPEGGKGLEVNILIPEEKNSTLLSKIVRRWR